MFCTVFYFLLHDYIDCFFLFSFVYSSRSFVRYIDDHPTTTETHEEEENERKKTKEENERRRRTKEEENERRRMCFVLTFNIEIV